MVGEDVLRGNSAVQLNQSRRLVKVNMSSSELLSKLSRASRGHKWPTRNDCRSVSLPRKGPEISTTESKGVQEFEISLKTSFLLLLSKMVL